MKETREPVGENKKRNKKEAEGQAGYVFIPGWLFCIMKERPMIQKHFARIAVRRKRELSQTKGATGVPPKPSQMKEFRRCLFPSPTCVDLSSSDIRMKNTSQFHVLPRFCL